MSISVKPIAVGKVVFGGAKLAFIAGPCVIESREGCLAIAEELAAISKRLDLPFVFKASFDKANRTSLDAYRGPGLEKGLEILAEVKARFGDPLLRRHKIGSRVKKGTLTPGLAKMEDKTPGIDVTKGRLLESTQKVRKGFLRTLVQRFIHLPDDQST